MFSVMTNERARTADRLDAAKRLGDRAFGSSVQPIDLDITSQPSTWWSRRPRRARARDPRPRCQARRCRPDRRRDRHQARCAQGPARPLRARCPPRARGRHRDRHRWPGHLNKTNSRDAYVRVANSVAFWNAARSVVARHAGRRRRRPPRQPDEGQLDSARPRHLDRIRFGEPVRDRNRVRRREEIGVCEAQRCLRRRSTACRYSGSVRPCTSSGHVLDVSFVLRRFTEGVKL
jgi:hypothetical protein